MKATLTLRHEHQFIGYSKQQTHSIRTFFREDHRYFIRLLSTKRKNQKILQVLDYYTQDPITEQLIPCSSVKEFGLLSDELAIIVQGRSRKELRISLYDTLSLNLEGTYVHFNADTKTRRRIRRRRREDEDEAEEDFFNPDEEESIHREDSQQNVSEDQDQYYSPYQDPTLQIDVHYSTETQNICQVKLWNDVLTYRLMDKRFNTLYEKKLTERNSLPTKLGPRNAVSSFDYRSDHNVFEVIDGQMKGTYNLKFPLDIEGYQLESYYEYQPGLFHLRVLFYDEEDVRRHYIAKRSEKGDMVCTRVQELEKLGMVQIIGSNADLVVFKTQNYDQQQPRIQVVRMTPKPRLEGPPVKVREEGDQQWTGRECQGKILIENKEMIETSRGLKLEEIVIWHRIELFVHLLKKGKNMAKSSSEIEWVLEMIDHEYMEDGGVEEETEE